MTDKEILDMIDQRLSNLTKDLHLTPKGVSYIMIETIIDELRYLKWAISNSNQENYTSSGFRYKSF